MNTISKCLWDHYLRTILMCIFHRFNVNMLATGESDTASTISTEITIPLEYDTDHLRDELTQFGTRPGPISGTTKQLYLKRLMRLKRNVECGGNAVAKIGKRLAGTNIVFSILFN